MTIEAMQTLYRKVLTHDVLCHYDSKCIGMDECKIEPDKDLARAYNMGRLDKPIERLVELELIAAMGGVQ